MFILEHHSFQYILLVDFNITNMLFPGGPNRPMGMNRPPMAGAGDWGMSSSSPVGHPGMGRPGMDHNPKGMMGGPMVNRSNSVPANRSILQQQLMEMGRCLFRITPCLYWTPPPCSYGI